MVLPSERYLPNFGSAVSMSYDMVTLTGEFVGMT
jgi:hypothetical protein